MAWLVIGGFLALVAWNVVHVNRERRRRDRWIRTGFDLDPHQAEEVIDGLNRAEAEDVPVWQGKP